MEPRKLIREAMKTEKTAVSWSKGHFDAVAEIIKGIKNKDIQLEVANKFAEQFIEANKNFDKERFLKACGLSASQIKE
jgi:hypothetical protein